MAKRRHKQSKKPSASRVTDKSSPSNDAPIVREEEEPTVDGADTADRSIKQGVLGTLLLLLALAAATFVAHGLCLKNPFYLDDQTHILTSARLHSGEWWGIHHRIIPYAFWIWLHSNWGFDSAAFHALNLIVHTLTVFATYLAAREFARIEQVKHYLADTPITRSFPFFAALLFGVHTLCSEVINYAAQTSIQLVTLFTMLATAAMFRWLSSARWWWLIAAFLATALAAISKKPGIWHALVNLALVAVIFWKARPSLQANQPLRRWPLLVATVLFLVLCYYFLQQWHLLQYIGRIFSDPEMRWHWLTQSRVFWEYLWRMFLPLNLCSDHWIPITRTTGDVVAWIGAAGILALLVGTVVLFWRQRVYCLLLALTLAPLLLRFAFRNQEPFVEYRTYPTMPWFCMLAVLFAGAFLLKRIRTRHFAIGASVVALLFAGLSAKRSTTWNSAHSLVIDIRKQYPLHIRSQSFIQSTDFSQRKFHDVMDRQVLVRRITRDILDYNQKNKHRQYTFDRTISSFLFSEQCNAYALIELGRSEEAVARTTEVIDSVSRMLKTDRSRSFAALYRVRGEAQASLGDFGAAAADFRRALERKPDDLDTPKLISLLPPKYRAAALSQPE